MLFDNVTFISYMGGTVLFAALFIVSGYLVLKSQASFAIAVATLFSTIWCALLAFDSVAQQISVRQLLVLETARVGIWVIAALQQIRFFKQSTQVRGPFLLLNALWVLLGLLLILVVPRLLQEPEQAYGLYVWGALLLTMVGVVAVEQLFRNATHHRLSKVLGIGMGGIFLYDLYLFSYAALFGQLDPQLWQARGAVNGFVAMFLAIGLFAVGPHSPLPSQMVISRPMAFYTTSLTAAGFFLALMAAGGYYIKSFGGNWGSVLQVTLILSALIAIAVMFISDSARTRLSVFIDKHFFVHKYDYRSQWLNLIHQLSSSGDSSQDYHHRAIAAVASTFKSPGGMLWLSNKYGKMVPAATLNLNIDTTDLEEPEDSPFCRIMEDHEWVFSPHAPPEHELSNFNEALPDWIRTIPDIWLVIPLLVDKALVGFIILTRPSQQSLLTWEDLDLLKTVGREVAVYVSRNEAAELLAQSKQFDAYNKLSAFVMHDLKNLIAQQALVVENAAKHKENPAFIDDMIRTIDNSVQRMSNLLKKLQQTQPSSGRPLPLKSVVVNSVKKCQDRLPRPSLRIMDDSLKVVADEENLEMIITHIIKNAQEATPSDGYVDVTLRADKGFAVIDVEDNGSGMDADFIRTRLFRPFDTTKSGKGMGIGVYQTREFIRNLGGDVTVKSEPKVGTTFTISIPVYTPKTEES